MTHPNRRIKEAEIEARRERVGALLLAGVRNMGQIADQLGVDRSTISRDIKALEQVWRELAAQEIAAARGQDLARLDRLVAAHWSSAIKGNTASTDRVIALLDRRAKLLGLNAPVRIDVRQIVEETAARHGLTEEERIALHQQVAAHLQATNGARH